MKIMACIIFAAICILNFLQHVLQLIVYAFVMIWTWKLWEINLFCCVHKQLINFAVLSLVYIIMILLYVLDFGSVCYFSATFAWIVLQLFAYLLYYVL